MYYQFIYQTLKNNPAVNALLGTKIYPQVAPQEVTAPYCTYNLVSEGPSECRETHDPLRVQVSIFCEGYTELQQIKAAVKGALHRQSTPELECDFENGAELYENGDLLRHAALDFQLIIKK